MEQLTLDVVDIDGAVQADGTITVGVDDTGYDVKFFGATTGKSLLWDESADTLIVTGDSTVSGTLGVTGVLTATSLDISGDIDVDGTTNLDVVDIDGAVDFGSTTAHAGNATFADNAKAIFGAGSDLQIYHDGTHSRIVDAGTGNLNLQGDNLRLKTADAVGTYLEANNGGAVTITYNSSPKLATTATGIDVTGTVTADGATFSGNVAVTKAAGNTAIMSVAGNGNTVDVTDAIIAQDGGNNKMYVLNRANAPISFGTADVIDKMVLDASGNVGIGGSPSSTLDVGCGVIADPTLRIDSAAGGDPVLLFDTGAASRSSFVDFRDQGTLAGSIIYSHVDDHLGFSVASNNRSEAMRINSGGNLLVGKSASAINTDGVELLNSGRMFLTTTSLAHVIRRKSTDGSLVEFQKDGTTVGSITTVSGNIAIGRDDTALYISATTDSLTPATIVSGVPVERDDGIDIGRASARFDDIYATNGTIQTSDRNEKQDIEELSDAEQRVAVAAKGLLRKFRWKSSVAEKGGETTWQQYGKSVKWKERLQTVA
jgi:hypothetical protein